MRSFHNPIGPRAARSKMYFCGQKHLAGLEARAKLGTRIAFIDLNMSRPKTPEERRLNHFIRLRVNAAVYARLTALQKQTDCRSISELARKILSRENITLLHRDVSMNGPMEELALIRKEIKAIGININQQAHYFHISQSPAERAFYVKRTAELYSDVDQRIARLLKLVHRLSMIWLQK